jgi:hypothetical protein
VARFIESVRGSAVCGAYKSLFDCFPLGKRTNSEVKSDFAALSFHFPIVRCTYLGSN